MSWDIFISKTPVDQLEAAEFEPLGDNKEVIQLIVDVVPTTNFTDPTWGNYRDDECSIEFNIGDDTPVQHMMLHIRGSGTRPIAIIKALCERINGYAMDGSTGEQMNFDEVDEQSFNAWQEYRDKIINK